MTFPLQRPQSASAFLGAYADQVSSALRSVDGEVLGQVVDLLISLSDEGGSLFVCGNGGSAAISNHLVCDFVKGARTDTNLRPRVMSLSSNVELLTAVANDISYDEVFRYQVASQAKTGDVLMSISSSGDSENIVRAVQWANENDMATIALTGFGGGRSRDLARYSLHVEGDNYGVIEDAHQSLMHVIAQYMRLSRMDAALVKDRKF